MRHLLAPIALLALVPTQALAGVVPDNFVCIDQNTDPAKLSLARNIVNASVPNDQGDQMMRQMLGAVLQAFKPPTAVIEGDPRASEILDRRIKEIPDRLMPVVNRHLPQIFGSTACAYAKEFSLSELTEIHTFAQTPAGRRFLTSAPRLMSDPNVQQAFQAYMADIQTTAREFGMEIGKELSELPEKPVKK